MKKLLSAIGFFFVLFFAAPSFAWDGPNLWYAPANGASPGGGGILGTGGARDYAITCAHCHVEGAGKIDAKIELDPPLATMNGASVYEPGQTYNVTVSLIGEYLGVGACEQYMMRTNNMAVAFEDVGGKVAGSLASDSGQSAASCPKDAPMSINGTTVLYGDCRAVMGSGAENMTAWTFSWTAPPKGTGDVTVFYGVVDGDCDMSSQGDDVKVGSMKLGESGGAIAPVSFEPKPVAPSDGGGAPIGALLIASAFLAALLLYRIRRGGPVTAENEA